MIDIKTIFHYLIESGPVSVLTFFLGFFASRLTMTKKEKKDYEQKTFENGRDLMKSQNDTFQEFFLALQKYNNNNDRPTFDDFCSISLSGEKYFYQQKITADAILSSKVDRVSRDETLVPKLRETIEKTLPKFYSTLQHIARKNGYKYSGNLKRSNYESIYSAVEKFSAAGTSAAGAARVR